MFQIDCKYYEIEAKTSEMAIVYEKARLYYVTFLTLREEEKQKLIRLIRFSAQISVSTLKSQTFM